MTEKNNFAEVYGKSLAISSKYSIIVCDHIRNKNLASARRILEDVVNMKRALVFSRYNMNLCHKPGLAAARYPVNTSKVFLKLLDSVESNASNKGLNVNNLIISYAKADRAETRPRSGRKGRVNMKSTHVKIRVEEK